MSFSNSGGATLALPSPTHPHQIDVTSVARSLRRSMSRSPSKFLSRASPRGSEGSQSQQASPQSPCRRFGFTPQPHPRHLSQSYSAPAAPLLTQPSTISTQSPLGTPLRPSVKLSLRSAKSTRSLTPTRPVARARASPKSPLKRALNTSSDSVNCTQLFAPSPSGREFFEQENRHFGPRSPATRSGLDKPSRHSCHLDVSGASQLFLKNLDTPSPSSPSLSSTLKRSDATMNLDQPAQGSPVAKRRSLHGISNNQQSEELGALGSSSTSFPQQSFKIHQDASDHETIDFSASVQREPMSFSTPGSNLPKRTSSLRKSTLQQRYGEKGSLSRRTGERHLAQFNPFDSSPAQNRPGLSPNQFDPPAPGDSLFSQNKPLPNASVHPLDSRNHAPPRHPLSQWQTSSSGSVTGDRSPLYVSAQVVAPPKLTSHPFARSLPLNAPRPMGPPVRDFPEEMSTPGANPPAPSVFHSTGLISKINRNPEDEATRLVPPDTPCKKPAYNPFNTYPPVQGMGSGKKLNKFNNRNSYGGIPSTPHEATSRATPGTFGNFEKGLSIFKRDTASRNTRRGSLLGPDGDDGLLAADSVDSDVPPTPTRNTLTPSLSNVTESSLESPSNHRTISVQAPMSAVRPPFSRESTSSPVDGRRTPQTPQENLSVDTGFASLMRPGEARDSSMQPPPVTPTAERDFRSSTSIFVTPVNARTSNVDLDSSLTHKFDNVELIGKGEFSTVYRVTKVNRPSAFKLFSETPNRGQASPAKSQIFAVKKSKNQLQGPRDRKNKLREVVALQALRDTEHVVQYVQHWEHNLHLFIQTEFCEEGTLEKFLGNVGRSARLDDFRIFKILQDLCLGLREIHDAGFMHLDMKPANILINFEGALKIGDFGLAQRYPLTEETEDGDREYMAPEVLDRGQVSQATDIFSLGLMTLEAAANVILPDNGQIWANLRSGDLSDVPSLTWNPSSDVQRDATGNPTQSDHSDGFQNDYTHDAGNLFGSFKRPELPQAPEFMVDPTHHSSLDRVVRWMTARDPTSRPIAEQVLDLEGLRWVADHRTAPATVYEGSWGPMEPLPVMIAGDSDTEMTDA